MTVSDHELPGHNRPLLESHPQAWSDSFHGLKGLKDGRAVAWALESLRPEILSRRKAHHADRSKTAWLDGLRGWAALIVCFVHLTVYTHPGIESCYGSPLPLPGQLGVSDELKNETPAAWPILRVLWNGGHFAVMVFFTMSGYVLTKRLISLLHEGRHADFITSLHSSICRRPLRLFLPVLWSTLILLTVWHVTGLTTPWPPREDNILLELIAWTRESGKFIFFFRTGFLFTYYNIHTWTIPVELRGSLFLFVWLFAVAQMPHKTRFLLTLGMVFYLVFVAPGAMYATFFAGMVTAELDLIASGAAQISLPWDRLMQALGSHWIVRSIVLHAALLSALYLGGQPAGDGDLASAERVLGTCHGWKTLGKMIPKSYPSKGSESATHRWFWLFWASWLLVIACKEIHWLKRGLEGRISQCLYLFLPYFRPPFLLRPMLTVPRPWKSLICTLSNSWTHDWYVLRTAVLSVGRQEGITG